jgi:AcrR family transcriptional regulator
VAILERVIENAITHAVVARAPMFPKLSSTAGRMARPREFDEQVVLDAALVQFWSNGYESTSTRDLAQSMGITSASLYNAFGDKRSLYRRVLQHYVERSLEDRLRRYAPLAPHLAPGSARPNKPV